jgi:DNA-binding NtrC family response regulator
MTQKNSAKTSLLIVDDNQDVLDSLDMFLKEEFDEIHLLRQPERIPRLLKKYSVDVVLLDMNFQSGAHSGKEGLQWLSRILEYDSQIVVIMLTAYGDIGLAVKAIKQGATDFIVKPWDNDKLVSTLKAGVKLSKSQQELKNLQEYQRQRDRDHRSESEIVWGNSAGMVGLRRMVEKIANTDTNVLLLGENGTGKELIAEELHVLSDRSDKPFVKVDMGTLNENMFESEMFGHERGAFTNARERRRGRFEIAHQGTLFLDEISNLPVYLQAKLLSAIQNRVIYRVGSNDPIDFDIRIISATNKNLDDLVGANLFRQDLLYRLKTIQLEVPPVRQRGDEDLMLLAHHFLERYKKKYDKPNLKMGQDAGQKLRDHSWPGNIRELMHTLEKAVILNETGLLTKGDFLLSKVSGRSMHEDPRELDLSSLERRAIERAIVTCNHNMSQAARELGISRPTLYKKMKQYNIRL